MKSKNYIEKNGGKNRSEKNSKKIFHLNYSKNNFPISLVSVFQYILDKFGVYTRKA